MNHRAPLPALALALAEWRNGPGIRRDVLSTPGLRSTPFIGEGVQLQGKNKIMRHG